MNIFKKITPKFTKKQYATGVVVPKPVVGITSAEYLRIADALNEEYENARARQKPESKRPSGYMKGLKRAIEIVDSVKPHTLAGGL